MTAVLFPSRTAFTSRTLKAERLTKQKMNVRPPPSRFAFLPQRALLALGTGRRHRVPINTELRLVIAALGARLPTGIHSGRPQQVNSIRLAAAQVICIDIAGICP